MNNGTMLIVKEEKRIYRTLNNAGERAKFYIRYIKFREGIEAVIVTKLTLTKTHKPAFKLIYMRKDVFIYMEKMVFKPETLCIIIDLVKSMT